MAAGRVLPVIMVAALLLSPMGVLIKLMRHCIFAVVTVVFVASSARADLIDPRRSWPSCSDDGSPAALAAPALTTFAFPATQRYQDSAQPVHPVAIEHSDAYQTRAKIHKWASFATLPLFAAEVALGQSLDGSNDSKKGAHAFVGAGIVGLFGVNAVTGAWNLFGEGRQDTEGRKLRLVHGLLMMAADAGFLATTAAAPSTGRNGAVTFEAGKTTHRNLAIASVSVGAVGYLMMIFGNR